MKVWDLPTRIFHWTIILLVAGAWYTAEFGLMQWHYSIGLAALALVAFRLLWGVAGGATSRFSSFVRSPRAVFSYLRAPSTASPRAGHNPLGGYSVIAMLAALVLQISTGVLAVDVDGIESGPLSYLITFDNGRFAAEVHGTTFVAIQALVVLHLLAIAFYRIRGRRLIMPMVTGRDPQLEPKPAAIAAGGLMPALLCIAAASGLAWWISAGAPL